LEPESTLTWGVRHSVYVRFGLNQGVDVRSTINRLVHVADNTTEGNLPWRSLTGVSSLGPKTGFEEVGRIGTVRVGIAEVIYQSSPALSDYSANKRQTGSNAEA